MSNLVNKQSDVLSLTLDGFQGPIDLLLSLARDHKIDLSKLSILPLAEQYLEFLDYAIKKDIDVAAEYLVMGAWLAFLKSKILLPVNNDDDTNNYTKNDIIEGNNEKIMRIIYDYIHDNKITRPRFINFL